MQNVLPIQQRPYNAYGEYMVDLRSGVMAAGLAGDSEIYQFRWSAATACLVTEVRLWVASGGTSFAGSWASFRLFAARAWTVDGTGGATSTITTNSHKLRTGMPTTAIGTARIATTSVIGAGTKTLDAQALSSAGCDTTASLSLQLPAVYLIGGAPARSPVILAQNEGLSLVATVPATGTWVFGVSVRYEEAQEFRQP